MGKVKRREHLKGGLRVVAIFEATKGLHPDKLVSRVEYLIGYLAAKFGQ